MWVGVRSKFLQSLRNEMSSNISKGMLRIYFKTVFTCDVESNVKLRYNIREKNCLFGLSTWSE